MEQETQELLDEYNETYCWEYNDMVDFIKEYGEKKFRDYYEDYYRAVDDLGEDIVNAFIEVFYIESIGNIEESYQGQMTGEEFRVVHQSDLLVARQALGMGVLRSEAAAKIVIP